VKELVIVSRDVSDTLKTSLPNAQAFPFREVVRASRDDPVAPIKRLRDPRVLGEERRLHKDGASDICNLSLWNVSDALTNSRDPMLEVVQGRASISVSETLPR
jgi:hypothetical protein